MASLDVAAEKLQTKDYIYEKSLTVRTVQVLEGTGVIVEGTRNGTGKQQTHTFEPDCSVWIHRTSWTQDFEEET